MGCDYVPDTRFRVCDARSGLRWAQGQRDSAKVQNCAIHDRPACRVLRKAGISRSFQPLRLSFFCILQRHHCKGELTLANAISCTNPTSRTKSDRDWSSASALSLLREQYDARHCISRPSPCSFCDMGDGPPQACLSPQVPRPWAAQHWSTSCTTPSSQATSQKHHLCLSLSPRSSYSAA
ncbi:hypothetical protein CC79DRAFT_1112137 [Sarocladium strictum]